MSDWNRRMPRIGDLIVHKNPRTGEARRFGLVHKIKKDKQKQLEDIMVDLNTLKN